MNGSNDKDSIDDVDVRDTVRTAGADVPPQFRTAMRDSLEAALRGERVLEVAEPVSASGATRGRWLAAAAAVLVVATVAAILAFSGDDRGTLTPATEPTNSTTPAVSTSVEPTTDVPTTAAPTTVVPTTVANTDPTAPLPDPAIPLLSVDASLPGASARPVLESAGSDSSQRWPVHAARFQGDGWTVTTRRVANGPLAVEHFGLDGAPAWSVTVPSSLAGRQQTGSVELGPNDVLYVYYEGVDGAQVTAVPTSGSRAGTTVATWLVPNTCYETYCGPPMDVNGLLVSDTATTPYVDGTGAPTTATFERPVRASTSDALGPAMPADWVRFEDISGSSLISQRSTVTLGSTSWTFDAVGVMMAGDFYFLRQFVLGDGGVLVWFTTSDGAGAAATRNRQFLGRLMPDGTSSFVEIPLGVIDVMGRDGRVYATTYDVATDTYALLELLVA